MADIREASSMLVSDFIDIGLSRKAGGGGCMATAIDAAERAMRQIRLATIEECARVAELNGFIGQTFSEVQAKVEARREIARAIRALASKEG